MILRRQRQWAGFTLVELLVTLVVLSVLGAAAAPSYGQLRAAAGVRIEARRLHDALLQARTLAVAAGEPVVVCPTLDGAACTLEPRWGAGWMTFRDHDLDGAPEATEAVERHFAAPPSSVEIDAPASRTRLRFRSDGAASGSNLTFRICDRARRVPGRTVVLAPSGRVRITDPAPGTCRGSG